MILHLIQMQILHHIRFQNHYTDLAHLCIFLYQIEIIFLGIEEKFQLQQVSSMLTFAGRF